MLTRKGKGESATKRQSNFPQIRLSTKRPIGNPDFQVKNFTHKIRQFYGKRNSKKSNSLKTKEKKKRG